MMIWLSLWFSRSWLPLLALSALEAIAEASLPALSVYDAKSTLDRVREGGGSLELFVRSGLVAGFVAGVVLRGDGRGS